MHEDPSGEHDPRDLEAIATLVAGAAARLIRSNVGRPTRLREKSSPTDVVTRTDLDAEELIRGLLAESTPGARVLGEEGPEDLRLEPRRRRLDEEAARGGGAVRRRLGRSDRVDLRARGERARRGQRGLRRARRRLEVPQLRRLLEVDRAARGRGRPRQRLVLVAARRRARRSGRRRGRRRSRDRRRHRRSRR